MKPVRYSIPALGFLLCTVAVMPAQQPPATGSAVIVSSSTVSGSVTLSDTNMPARFGRVLLKSTAGGGLGDDFTRRLQQQMEKAMNKPGHAAPKPPTPEQARLQTAAARNMNHATDLLNASTIGLKGEYSFARVKPGTYYVHVLLPGYIDPLAQFSDDDLASTDPAMRARIAASVPIVTVTGTDAAHVDLRLQRGASISGHMQYEDGSPAVGWIVTALKPTSPAEPEEVTNAAMTEALLMSGAIPAAKTDDLGNYRISGLPGGQYIVRATLTATDIGVSATNMAESGSGIKLTLYAGGTLRKDDAKPLSIHAGGNYPGVDLKVSSNKWHTIVGHVYAKSDQHAVNAGAVSLVSMDKSITARAAIRDDGSFHFEYLPSGTYTVKVESASDAHTTGATSLMGLTIPTQDTLRKYGTDSTEVTLNDVDLDSVHMVVAETDWKPSVKKHGGEMDPGKALGALLGGLLSGDDEKPAPDLKPAPAETPAPSATPAPAPLP